MIQASTCESHVHVNTQPLTEGTVSETKRLQLQLGMGGGWAGEMSLCSLVLQGVNDSDKE